MALPQDYLDNPDFQPVEAVFHEWVAQGQGRKVPWLVERTGLPITLITKAIVKGQWMQRIQEIDRDASKRAREGMVHDVSVMNTRDVSRLIDIEGLSWDALELAFRDNRVPPATAAKLLTFAMERRREMLGLTGASTSPLQKLLEGALDKDPEGKPDYEFDRKKLEAPPELPEMPGMTSDFDSGESEDLTDEDRQRLRDAGNGH